MNKGVYIYIEDNEPFLFIYKQATQDVLKRALSITFNNNVDKDYLCVIFHKNGQDYLGQSDRENIHNIIDKLEHIDIMEREYRQLPDIFKQCMDKCFYEMWKDFAITQLDSF